MHPTAMNRRNFLRSGAALAATPALWAQESHAQGAVPNSSGTDAPKLKAPANACDCHMHVYDAERFPPLRRAPRLQTNARVTEYRRLQQRIGTTRTIVVTPAVYVTDNGVTLDAVAQFGSEARGVAVIHPTITDAELKAYRKAHEYAKRHEVEHIFLDGLFGRLKEGWPLDRAIAAAAINAGNCAPGME